MIVAIINCILVIVVSPNSTTSLSLSLQLSYIENSSAGSAKDSTQPAFMQPGHGVSENHNHSE